MSILRGIIGVITVLMGVFMGFNMLRDGTTSVTGVILVLGIAFLNGLL